MDGRCRIEKEQISLEFVRKGGTGHFAFTTLSHVTCIAQLSVLSPVLFGRRFTFISFSIR